MPDRVVVSARLDEHVSVADRGLEAARVVGPHVERASRHEIEARVVPVARDEPGLHRALVEREAQVGAPVLDRVRGALVPEHHDGDGADLGDQPARLLQLRERPGPGCGDRICLFDHSKPFCKCSIAII